jgi:hypothetical protein
MKNMCLVRFKAQVEDCESDTNNETNIIRDPKGQGKKSKSMCTKPRQVEKTKIEDTDILFKVCKSIFLIEKSIGIF